MSWIYILLLATALGTYADELMTSPQEVRAQVEKTMGAFVSMDLEQFKAGLAEGVVSFEMDMESKPVRLGSRDEVVRWAEEMFTEVKKMGATMNLDIHSCDCRGISTLAYCTVEFDFKMVMADSSMMVQPSRNSVVLLKDSKGWKWMHWHSSLAVPPIPPASEEGFMLDQDTLGKGRLK